MFLRLSVYFLLISPLAAQTDLLELITRPIGAGGGLSQGNLPQLGRVVVKTTTGNEMAGGPSVSIDGNVVMLGDFTGQLLNEVQLEITADLFTIPEQGARQLNANVNIANTTRVSIPPEYIAWNIISGPLVSISPFGVATADAVESDTFAIAQGVFFGIAGTVQLLVTDDNPDNFGSYAGDGIDDDWQIQYFGFDNPNAGPTKDPDQDGQNNQFEFTALSDPTDPSSVFNINVGPAANAPDQMQIVFEPIAPGRTYHVEFSPDLTPGSFHPVPDLITSTFGTRRIVFDPAPSAANRFYRVKISKP